MALMKWWEAVLTSLVDGSVYQGTVEFLTWTPLVLVWFLLMPVMAWGRRKAGEVVAMPSPTPALGAERLLIIRSSADEASGFLTIAAFVSACVGWAWAPVGRVADWLTNALYEIPDNDSAPLKLRRFADNLNALAWMLFIILLLAGAAIQGLGYFQAGSTEAAAFGRWILFPLLGVVLIPVVGATAYFVVLIPFAVVIGAVSVVAGPELFLAAFTHELTVEPTPPGTWTVHQIFGLAAQRRLEHSSYSDASVPRVISEWIIEREADNAAVVPAREAPGRRPDEAMRRPG
jgi:hypothetical protein